MRKSKKYAVTPRFRDTDMLGHVNNAVYISYLEIGRLQWYLETFGDKLENFPFILARTEIDYLKPMFLNAKPIVEMWVSNISKSSWEFEFLIYDDITNVEYAKAKNILVHYDFKQGKSLPLDEKHIKLLEAIKN